VSDDSPVDRVDEPVTPTRIARDCQALGVAPDATLLVHASLSSLGWVPGGPQGAVEGLRRAVPEGTLVVPTHSTQLTDPGDWENPPVPESWHGEIRAATPAYDPDATPTRAMGAIPDCLRDYDAAVRSAHPHYSFAALGPDADRVTRDHGLADGMGEGSPLAAVDELNGSVLVLGCPLGRNTSLHLAEHRADIDHEFERQGAPVRVDGEREWVEFQTLAYEDEDFGACAAALADEHPEHATTGSVGAAEATLYDQPALVAFAAGWLTEHRG
jgi:aminoglycoside 3-N-acetyltransferase